MDGYPMTYAKAMRSQADIESMKNLVVSYACGLDARDWTSFRSLFLDQIELDYAAVGSLVGSHSADGWTARCGALEEFDATLHRISNQRCSISGDGAVVDSYVDAVHFLTLNEGVLLAHISGAYVHGMRRNANGEWRIASVTLRAAGYPNGKENFDRAFAIVRDRYANRPI